MHADSPMSSYLLHSHAPSPRVPWNENEVQGAVALGLYPAHFQRRVQSHLPIIVNCTSTPGPLSATPELVSSPRFQRRIASNGSSAASPLIGTPREDALDVERPSLEGTKYSPLGTVYSSSESIPQLQTPVNTTVATPRQYNTPSSNMYSPFRPDAESTPAYVLAAERRQAVLGVGLEPVSEEPAAPPPRLNPRAPSFKFSPHLAAPASPAPTLLERQHIDGSSTVRPNGTTPMPSRFPTEVSLVSRTSSFSLPVSAMLPRSGYRRLATPFADFRWWESVTHERELRAKALPVSVCAV